MRDFRNLTVWEKAHQVTLAIYRATMNFPQDERYGLTNQMRRAAVSVPTNIAEGCGRETDNELARFLYIAMGSASELEYQLLLAHELDFLNAKLYQQINSDLVEVKKILNTFIQKLKAKS